MANTTQRDNALVTCPGCGAQVHQWKINRKKHHCAPGLVKSRKRRAKTKKNRH